MITALVGYAPRLAEEAVTPPVERRDASRDNVLKILEGIHVPRRSRQAEESVGVEIKLASSLLRTSEAYRLVGQALHYRKRYGPGLLIVVAGLSADLAEPLLIETRDLLESFDIRVHFLVALQ